MVKYQVEISDEAKDALKKIYDWLKEEESLSVAQKVRGGILDAVSKLATMPQRHKILEEISDDQMVFRRVLKWSYQIIYFIDEQVIKVQVVEIIHSKRNPEQLKGQLKK